MAGRQPVILKTILTSRGAIEYNIYDFLKEMKNKPVIWNRMHIDNKNAAVSEKNWKALSTIFVPFFEELDEDEKTRIVEEFKSYWLNLRTNLRSTLLLVKKRKSSHCHYLRHMEFFLETKHQYLKDIATEKELQQLLEFEIKMRAQAGLPPPEDLNNKKSSGQEKPNVATNSKRPNPINDNKKVVKKAKITNVTASPAETSCNTSFNPLSMCETTSQPSLAEDNVHEEVHNVSQFDYRQQQHITNVRVQNYTAENRLDLPDQSYDAHQAFFDSIKPTLRKLNDNQKLDFKIEVLKILKKHNLY